ALRKRARRQIAPVEDCRDPCNIALKRQREQIELELDVFVKRSGHPVGESARRSRSGGSACDFQPPLDLANILEIRIDAIAIACADVSLEARNVLENGIQNT